MANVLLATTDGMLGDVLEAEIRAENHDVCRTEDGQEALDRIFAGDMDLALLDRTLPYFSGLEICRMVRGAVGFATRPALILLSDEDMNPRELEKAKADALFPKTHLAAELRETLAEHLPPDSYL